MYSSSNAHAIDTQSRGSLGSPWPPRAMVAVLGSPGSLEFTAPPCASMGFLGSQISRLFGDYGDHRDMSELVMIKAQHLRKLRRLLVAAYLHNST
jgi:hypothetical protein